MVEDEGAIRMTHLHQHFTMSVCDNGTEALSDGLIVTDAAPAVADDDDDDVDNNDDDDDDDDNNEPVAACGMETAVWLSNWSPRTWFR